MNHGQLKIVFGEGKKTNQYKGILASYNIKQTPGDPATTKLGEKTMQKQRSYPGTSRCVRPKITLSTSPSP